MDVTRKNNPYKTIEPTSILLFLIFVVMCLTKSSFCMCPILTEGNAEQKERNEFSIWLYSVENPSVDTTSKHGKRCLLKDLQIPMTSLSTARIPRALSEETVAFITEGLTSPMTQFRFCVAKLPQVSTNHFNLSFVHFPEHYRKHTFSPKYIILTSQKG